MGTFYDNLRCSGIFSILCLSSCLIHNYTVPAAMEKKADGLYYIENKVEWMTIADCREDCSNMTGFGLPVAQTREQMAAIKTCKCTLCYFELNFFAVFRFFSQL